MEFQHQVEQLAADAAVSAYFANRDLLGFVKTYMQVDKVLSTSHTPNVLFDKLEEIRGVISTNAQQLSALSTAHSTMTSLIQQRIDSLAGQLKDVTNNDIKAMFGELQKQLHNEFDTQNLRNIIENFRDKMENLNTQKLNDFDRKTIDVLTTMQTNLLQSLDSHTISHKISSIEDNLTSLNQHFSNNSAKKGQLAESVLLSMLTDAFPDTEVVDTSHLPNSGDIQLVKENKPTILVDSKNFASKTVPKRDLDKFYADVQQHSCSGIICNAFGGIANKQHFEIDIVDKNVLVFVHSHQFDPSVFRLAVNIIYNMHDQIKDKQSDCINIDQRLYQNLKIEYNYYIQSFRHHLDIIKTNVSSLSQLSFTLLDNFFKRKATLVDLKSFTCHLCGTGCKTEKILKTHIKNQHQNFTSQAPGAAADTVVPFVVSVTDKKKGRPPQNAESDVDTSD